MVFLNDHNHYFLRDFFQSCVAMQGLTNFLQFLVIQSTAIETPFVNRRVNFASKILPFGFTNGTCWLPM